MESKNELNHDLDGDRHEHQIASAISGGRIIVRLFRFPDIESGDEFMIGFAPIKQMNQWPDMPGVYTFFHIDDHKRAVNKYVSIIRRFA